MKGNKMKDEAFKNALRKLKVDIRKKYRKVSSRVEKGREGSEKIEKEWEESAKARKMEDD